MTTSLRELEKRLAQEPDNLPLRVTVAGMLRESGRAPAAVEHYRKVAIAYRALGRQQQAIAVCRSILELAPTDIAIHALLAELTEPKTPVPAVAAQRPAAGDGTATKVRAAPHDDVELSDPGLHVDEPTRDPRHDDDSDDEDETRPPPATGSRPPANAFVPSPAGTRGASKSSPPGELRAPLAGSSPPRQSVLSNVPKVDALPPAVETSKSSPPPPAVARARPPAPPPGGRVAPSSSSTSSTTSSSVGRAAPSSTSSPPSGSGSATPRSPTSSPPPPVGRAVPSSTSPLSGSGSAMPAGSPTSPPPGARSPTSPPPGARSPTSPPSGSGSSTPTRSPTSPQPGSRSTSPPTVGRAGASSPTSPPSVGRAGASSQTSPAPVGRAGASSPTSQVGRAVPGSQAGSTSPSSTLVGRPALGSGSSKSSPPIGRPAPGSGSSKSAPPVMRIPPKTKSVPPAEALAPERPSMPPHRPSFEIDTPLPRPIPYHLADPTSSQMKLAREDAERESHRDTFDDAIETRPGEQKKPTRLKPETDTTGLAQAARRISGLISPNILGAPKDRDLAAELETRQRPRLSAEDLAKVQEPPPTVPTEQIVLDDELPTPLPRLAGWTKGPPIRDTPMEPLTDLHGAPPKRDTVLDVIRKDDLSNPVDLLGANPLANAFFTTLPPSRRDAAFTRCIRRDARAGSIVIRQGETAHSLILVVVGQLEVRGERANGSVVVLDTIHAGQYVGEAALLGRTPAQANVIALTDSELLAMPPHALFELAGAYPALWAALKDTAERRTRQYEKLIRA